ncbi:hypothetical protein TorRG33x02_176040 [Trema orientale]|uniref:Uncharacterized protein n=1 Tax=Trema orientale TaxID=63057 RepID=A0A2P5ELY3_TREOI|nr:hypothetical protein TorRG33x02_176040 [Trema orientale]
MQKEFIFRCLHSPLSVGAEDFTAFWQTCPFVSSICDIENKAENWIGFLENVILKFLYLLSEIIFYSV